MAQLSRAPGARARHHQGRSQGVTISCAVAALLLLESELNKNYAAIKASCIPGAPRRPALKRIYDRTGAGQKQETPLLSHANPETMNSPCGLRWSSRTRLPGMCDLTKLLGGEVFWDDMKR